MLGCNPGHALPSELQRAAVRQDRPPNLGSRYRPCRGPHTYVPAAIPALEATIAAGRIRGQLVGAGTVISGEQVQVAHKLGAAFTVAPGLDLAVLDDSHSHNMTHLPAVATPSEIQRAVGHGVRRLRAFPATSLGASWFAPIAVRSYMWLLATGGLTAQMARDFPDAGASAVSLGSSLTDPD